MCASLPRQLSIDLFILRHMRDGIDMDGGWQSPAPATVPVLAASAAAPAIALADALAVAATVVPAPAPATADAVRTHAVDYIGDV